ncbi:hypothetical protein [Leisingera sp. M523]|uniref:hypothetical protein n=1 Tax=Leisingera sp. M523 TaxID=2867013 RepID=UPI0021A53101|nr:hypothetical protein [Leisingera sp. M523]UWQ30761.1 hypothetical protein K3557_09610 [Leisingera sp. M523]
MTGQPGMLAVGLDGTLRCSNILYEGSWPVFGQDRNSPFTSAKALFQGRAVYLPGAVTQMQSTLAFLPFSLIVLAAAVWGRAL